MCSLLNGKMEYKYGSRDAIYGILGGKKKGERRRNDKLNNINAEIDR